MLLPVHQLSFRGLPPLFLCTRRCSEEQQEVVLVIRGTFSAEDAFFDLLANGAAAWSVHKPRNLRTMRALPCHFVVGSLSFHASKLRRVRHGALLKRCGAWIATNPAADL